MKIWSNVLIKGNTITYSTMTYLCRFNTQTYNMLEYVLAWNIPSIQLQKPLKSTARTFDNLNASEDTPI